MNKSDATTVPPLAIRRTFAAPRTRVFAAWTHAGSMREWMCPPGFTVTDIQVDLREGGTFSMTMRYPERGKDQWTHSKSESDSIASYGTFKELREPERLAFTFCHEGDATDESIVVELLDRGNETEMLFTHEGFATERSRSEYEFGWPGAFQKLSELL